MQIKAGVPVWRHDDFREAGFSRFSLGLLPKLGGTLSFLVPPIFLVGMFTLR
jgi:hypothetical protein